MKKILLVLLSLFLLSQAQVLASEWKLDTVHTNFYFEVSHTYAVVRGQFMGFKGDVFFDPNNLEKSRFNFVIDVNSINTNVSKRDNHLRSPDFFDAGKYPEMTFKSNRVSRAGGNDYLVEGKLTIKDVSRDLVLVFTHLGQRENPLKKGELVTGLDADLKIDRLSYNVGDGKFYKKGVVGKDIDILITLELLKDM